MKKELQEIDEKINNYLQAIENSDKKEKEFSKIKSEELNQVIENLEKERKEIEEMLKEIETGKVDQVSKTDSDSRMMKTPGSGYQVSYNAQIAVDSKHHMIVESEVTNEQNDLKCLSQIAEKSKQILEVDNLKVVCDSGYFSEKEISDCEKNNIDCYVAIPRKFSNESLGMYGLSEFKFDQSTDTYLCPQNKEMTYKGTYIKGNRTLRRSATLKKHCFR